MMADQVMYERTLASLHDAMLDDTRWPAASARIDEACGMTGNTIERPQRSVRLPDASFPEPPNSGGVFSRLLR